MTGSARSAAADWDRQWPAGTGWTGRPAAADRRRPTGTVADGTGGARSAAADWDRQWPAGTGWTGRPGPWLTGLADWGRLMSADRKEHAACGAQREELSGACWLSSALSC
ncbi:hypothetical protein GCM10010399_76200 [Dactylosporangium fulvum]